jgi:pSer/pThr/pTyr-binding forkhead associated (FHA) protein
MHDSPLSAHAATPAELQARLVAARSGTPFLVLRDDAGTQLLVTLEDRERLSVGRRPENDLPLPWDRLVSRVHAELELVGGDWIAGDDGLSTNGTWVNDRRLSGRVRLRDGDLLRVGATVIAFCSPRDPQDGTALADEGVGATRLTPAQRRVLVALCRPALEQGPLAVPPDNAAIAADLIVSVDTVKTQLRALFEAFGLGDLPAAQKRPALIERALRTGAVTDRDLRE